MKKYLRILLVVLMTKPALAQDFHLSQYDAVPQMLNPALTGMNYNDASDYRFNANFRSQWKSFIPVPLNTYCIGGDFHRKRFGMGGVIISDRAGNGNLNRMGAYLSGAYKITNDPKEKHNLSVGLQMGIFQRSINPGNLNFDNQYSVDQGAFDNSIPNNETFSKFSVARFDASLGFNYTNADSAKKYNAFGGLSVFHITQPDQSFTSQSSRLPMKFTGYGGVNIQANKKLTIAPNILFMYQAGATEVNIGAMAYYSMKETQSILGGINYRNKDALIFHVGLKRKTNIYRISYDINTSSLNAYSHGRGALEFSVIYNYTKTPKKVLPEVIVPAPENDSEKK